MQSRSILPNQTTTQHFCTIVFYTHHMLHHLHTSPHHDTLSTRHRDSTHCRVLSPTRFLCSRCTHPTRPGEGICAPPAIFYPDTPATTTDPSTILGRTDPLTRNHASFRTTDRRDRGGTSVATSPRSNPETTQPPTQASQAHKKTHRNIWVRFKSAYLPLF